MTTAAEFNTGLEGLADRTAALASAAHVVSDLSTSASGGALKLGTPVYVGTGYLDDSESVTVPAPGRYLVEWSCSVKASDATDPLPFQASLVQSSNGFGFDPISTDAATRHSGTAAHYVHLSGQAIAIVTVAPGTDDGGTDDDGTFKVLCTAAGTITPLWYSLTIRRIG